MVGIMVRAAGKIMLGVSKWFCIPMMAKFFINGVRYIEKRINKGLIGYVSQEIL